MVRRSLEQRAGLPLLPSIVIADNDVHGKAPEGLKVSVRLELVPDAGAADLQYIGLCEQSRTLNGFSHGRTESCTVVQGDVITAGATDLHLHGHGLEVRQQLNTRQLKTMAFGRGRGQ